MIPREDLANNLLQELLNGGYADVKALLDEIAMVENTKFTIHGSEEFLAEEGTVISTIIDEAKEISEGKVDVNGLFYGLYEFVIRSVGEKYEIQFEGGEDYEVYTNYLDSHLYLTDKGKEKLKELLSPDEAEEVEDIIENFN
jgi:hypothetical protein